jgi:hypothetical protein
MLAMPYSPQADKSLLPATPPNFTPWYLISLVIIILLVVIGILGLTLIRPTMDNTQLISTLVGIALLAIPALLGFVKSAENGVAIQNYHVAVNSKMDELIATAKQLSQMQGIEAGRLLQTEATNKVASDTLAIVTAKDAVVVPVSPEKPVIIQRMIDHSKAWGQIFH